MLDFFAPAKATTEKPVVDSEGAAEFADIDLQPLDSDEKVNGFRKQHRIKVSGTDIPKPLQHFEELFDRMQMRKYLRRNLLAAGYTRPTAVQMQTIPVALAERDVMAVAPTGSGKTLAYVLPLLHCLKSPNKHMRALIVTPTRELAQQIHRLVIQLCVGKPFKTCVLNSKMNVSKCDILVGTPLSIIAAIQSGSLSLDHVEHLVLDEADRLLDSGFVDQLDEIMAHCTCLTMRRYLFSATIPSSIEQLANSFMRDPVRIVIGHQNSAALTVKQKLLFVGTEEGKLVAIRQMVQQGVQPPVLVFVQSIERAKELFNELIYDGINVDVIHSERTQSQREMIVANFRRGTIWVLIATELLARGLDFKGINLVINYDFPQSVQSYIHRIGRTGRAGRQGEAVTYFTKDDAPYLKSIVNVIRESGCEVPEWMLSLKNPTGNQKKHLKRKPIERAAIKTSSSYDAKRIKHKKQMIEQSKKQ